MHLKKKYVCTRIGWKKRPDDEAEKDEAEKTFPRLLKPNQKEYDKWK